MDPSSPLLVASARSHRRDLHILSAAFFFLFAAYGAAQNLESTVNAELGTTSLGILYLSFTVFLVVGAPMVRVIGSKTAMVVGTSGYWIFIASNLVPTWYTMLPASVYLGYCGSIIWVGQGTYLTSAARDHAKDFIMHEGTVLGSFNGEFWGIYSSSSVIGNLVSFVLLKGGKEGENLSGTNLLFSTFLGSMIVGTILMCFLSKRKVRIESHCEHSNFRSSIGSLLESIAAPLVDKRMLLIIPLVFYTGLEQAFVWAKFTKEVVTPSLGASGVGGAMAVFGFSDALCSFIVGRYTSGLYSISMTVTAGAFIQIFVLLWLIYNYSVTSGMFASFFPLVIAALWGIGNGIFNTQLSALFGMLFTNDTEGAFAQFKLWHSAAVAVVFFASPYVTFNVMSTVMVASLCMSMLSFLYLTLHVETGCVP